MISRFTSWPWLRTPERLCLILILLFATWRIGMNWFFMERAEMPAQIQADGEDYVRLATQIATCGEYRMSENAPPYSWKPPGYVLILAGLMKVAGDAWLSLYLFLQVLCGVAVTGIAYHLVQEWRGWKPALLAAWIVASYAPFHYLAMIFYREMIGLFLFALFLLLLRPQAYGRKTFIWFGLLLGIMGMVREEFMLLGAPTALAIVLGERRCGPGGWRRAIIKTAGTVAIILLIFSPWVYRNWHCFHRFQLLGTNGGVQLYMGHNPDIGPGYKFDYAFIGRVPEYKDHTDIEVSDLYAQRAWSFIREHPWRTVRNVYYKFVVAMESNMIGPDDLPFILFGMALGAAVGSFAGGGRRFYFGLIAGAMVCYVFARGLNLSLFVPNVQFTALRYLAAVGLVYCLIRREQLLPMVAFAVLFSVNLLFVPQNRHRWIVDLLAIQWAAVFFWDLLGFLDRRIRHVTGAGAAPRKAESTGT